MNMNIQPGTTSNGLANRPSHRLKPTTSDPSSARNIKISENKEIVVRDKNGGYKLDIPALPDDLIGEDGEELGDLEGDESGEMSFDRTELGGRDKESMFSFNSGYSFGLVWLICYEQNSKLRSLK